MKLCQLFLFLVLLSSCGNQTSETTNAPNAEVIPDNPKSNKMVWQDLYDKAEQEPIAYYQKKETQLQELSSDLTALQFINQMMSETEEGMTREIILIPTNELVLETGAQVVAVKEDNIPDDSISGEIRFFKMRKVEDNWHIAEVSSVWKCYPNRGLQDYSTEPCG